MRRAGLAHPESRFLAACRGRRADATPVWFMRQAGRYMESYRRIRRRHSILDICERPELAAEVTLQPVRRLGVDAAILFADILLPARPMGAKLEFRAGEGPSLSPRIGSRAAAARLKEFNPETELGFVLEAVRLVRKELEGSARRGEAAVPLIGFAGAPFTLASYLIEGGPSDHYLETKRLMHEDPGAWGLLMSKLSRITASYLRAQIKAGAQAVQLFDSWAGALSPGDYARFVLPYSRGVIRSLAPLGAPVIHFGTGTSGFLEEFSAAGGDVVGVDWRIPLDRAWRRIGPRGIQGNLDPALLATSGPAELRGAVSDVLRRAAGRPGHIFNLGHGILPRTPEARARAAVEIVHELTSR